MGAGQGDDGRRLRAVGWGVAAAGLMPSAVLGALRLGDPGAPLVIQAVALTPLGLPLALLGGLGALLATHWRGGRRGGLACGAAAALLVSAHAWWVAPLYFGAAPQAAAGRSVVVMTQNLEYGDGAAVVGEVLQHGVDVLVLTDVAPERLTAVRVAGVEEVLPHSAGIEGSVPDGSVVFSRYPLGGEIRISPGGHSRLVRLEVPGLGRLDVVALHPPPPYQQGAWHREFEALIRFLTERYREPMDQAVVLAGDFNATLDHAPVRRLVALGYADAAEQLNRGWLPTWPRSGSTRRLGISLPPLAAIDHVLSSPAIVATDISVSDAVGGDHRAVVATLGAAEAAE